MLVMVLAPSGVLGAVQQLLARRTTSPNASSTPTEGAA
jgi:hypothetical protein